MAAEASNTSEKKKKKMMGRGGEAEDYKTLYFSCKGLCYKI